MPQPAENPAVEEYDDSSSRMMVRICPGESCGGATSDMRVRCQIAAAAFGLRRRNSQMQTRVNDVTHTREEMELCQADFLVEDLRIVDDGIEVTVDTT
jgi:hypothetical protein